MTFQTSRRGDQRLHVAQEPPAMKQFAGDHLGLAWLDSPQGGGFPSVGRVLRAQRFQTGDVANYVILLGLHGMHLAGHVGGIQQVVHVLVATGASLLRGDLQHGFAHQTRVPNHRRGQRQRPKHHHQPSDESQPARGDNQGKGGDHASFLAKSDGTWQTRAAAVDCGLRTIKASRP